MKKSLNDQIHDLENTRAAKAARLGEITQKSIDEERSMDEAEATEFDELEADVAQVDKDLVRLRRLETIQAAKAAPIKAEGTQSGSEAREPSRIVAVAKKPEKGIQFARFVGCMAVARGSASEALSFAKARFPEEKPLHDVIGMFRIMSGDMAVKAAVNAGTTTDSSWAGPLVQYQDMASEFIEFLRPQTIVGRIPNLRRVPFNIRVPRQTSGGSAGWVGEGAPKPVTSTSFDTVTLGFTKLAAISVITEELARFSTPSAETIVRDTLAGALVQQMDSDFISPSNAGTANVKPPSITNNVTGIASTGNTASAVRVDMKNIFSQWIDANLSPASGVWIMSATTALSLSLMVNSLGQPEFPGITMEGGTFFGLPVVVSQAAGLLSTGSPSSPIVVLAKASDIMLADDGQVVIDTSREASLQMDSAPTNPPDGNTVFRSLWQTNSIGIRAERFVNWVKARDQAVQYLDNVGWTAA